jgi:hypothetical protein
MPTFKLTDLVTPNHDNDAKKDDDARSIVNIESV